MTDQTLQFNLRKRQLGLSLIEVMIALTLLSLVVVGIGTFFATLKENTNQQDNQLELNENLRIGMTRITEDLRNTGFMTPTKNLSSWITWTNSTFDSNPKIVAGASATAADELTIAKALYPEKTILRFDEIRSSSEIRVESVAGLGSSNSTSLININNRENMLIKSTNSATRKLIIDSNPTTAGTNEPTNSSHLDDSPVFLIQAKTYTVNQTNNTLLIDTYDGTNGASNPRLIVDGISNMKIVRLAYNHYQITLTGISEEADQDTGNRLEREMTSDVTLLNQ